jgi:hypothetical protein
MCDELGLRMWSFGGLRDVPAREGRPIFLDLQVAASPASSGTRTWLELLS